MAFGGRGTFNLAQIVGQLPATHNMLWWDIDAQATDFSQAYFTKTKVSITTGVVDSNIDVPVQSIIEDSTTGNHTVLPSTLFQVASVFGVSWRVAVLAKASGRRMVVAWQLTGSAASAISIGFDLAGGNVGYDNSVGADCTLIAANMVSVIGGWWLCTIDFTYTNTSPPDPHWVPQIYLDAGSGTGARNISYTGNGTSGIEVWWFNIMPLICWGMSPSFHDDFDSLSTIDTTNSKSPGFKWYVNNSWPNSIGGHPIYSQPPTAASTLSISGSILQIYNSANNANGYTSEISSCCTDGAHGYIGNAWTAPVLFEARVSWDNSRSAFFDGLPHTNTPAFWGITMNGLTGTGAQTTYIIEMDYIESFVAPAVSSSVHSEGAGTPDQSDHYTADYSSYPNGSGFFRGSQLWINMASNPLGYGMFLSFANGQYLNTANRAYNASVPAGSTYYLNDADPILIMLITPENTTGNAGGGLPLYVDEVTVFTKS